MEHEGQQNTQRAEASHTGKAQVRDMYMAKIRCGDQWPGRCRTTFEDEEWTKFLQGVPHSITTTAGSNAPDFIEECAILIDQ